MSTPLTGALQCSLFLCSERHALPAVSALQCTTVHVSAVADLQCITVCADSACSALQCIRMRWNQLLAYCCAFQFKKQWIYHRGHIITVKSFASSFMQMLPLHKINSHFKLHAYCCITHCNAIEVHYSLCVFLHRLFKLITILINYNCQNAWYFN